MLFCCAIGAISFFGCQGKIIMASLIVNYLEIEVTKISIIHFLQRLKYSTALRFLIQCRTVSLGYYVLFVFALLNSFFIVSFTAPLVSHLYFKCTYLLVNATTKSVFI